jgi:regulatory protein
MEWQPWTAPGAGVDQAALSFWEAVVEMKVTALRIQSRNKSRVNVYLDGKFAFGLAKIVAARLSVGQELDEAAVAQLRGVDDAEQTYERALKFLAPRPRSEAEVRRRLIQHKIDLTMIDAVVERLRAAGLVDDRAFASYWVENRAAFRPRSSRVLRAELRLKGLSDDTVREALARTDDEAAAYALASQRVRRVLGLPRDEFRRKLGDFLARRGFRFDLIELVVERLWTEQGAAQAPGEAPAPDEAGSY